MLMPLTLYPRGVLLKEGGREMRLLTGLVGAIADRAEVQILVNRCCGAIQWAIRLNSK